MKRFFTEKNVSVKCKSTNNFKISQIQTENALIQSNPNKKLHITFNQTKELCDSFNIPFTNQSLSSIAWDLYKMTNISSTGEERKIFSRQTRKQIIHKQKGRCNMCHEKKKKFEIDHIIPLNQKGTNELNNLQALCKKCHLMKTEKESMDKYFKCDYI